MNKKRKVAGPFTDLYRQSACQANQLAAGIYTAADTQLSKQLLSSLSDGKYSEIVSATVSPMDYTSADTFSRDYLCAELMSKYPHWDIGINRQAVALAKFAEVEAHLISMRFSDNPRLVCHSKSATMRAVESTARRKIAKILGDFSWDEAHTFFAFGPGASTSLSKQRGDAAYKFGAQRPHMSYNVENLADALVRAHPSWRFSADVVAGSRLVTVPKNAKTDRSICIEPDLNMYFQKGIGSMIRKRLQRWGLLLPEAQQINAELARQGSATGRLATVDLSSASDSISLDVVRRLVPPQWVTALEQCRSPFVVLPSGELHLLRKISSMGNGYTFELETVLFYSLALAVIEHFSDSEMDRRCTVFGDDIILSSDLVPVLEQVLSYFGFTLNPKKTFHKGPFRESCGKHFFAGSDVTPFYVRDRIDTVPRKYWAANTVKRYSRLHWGLDSRYHGVYDAMVNSIPPFFRKFMIPEGVGDGGLVVDWDEARPTRHKSGLDAWTYEDIIPRYGDEVLEGTGVLLKSLHKLEYGQARPSAAKKVVSKDTPWRLYPYNFVDLNTKLRMEIIGQSLIACYLGDRRVSSQLGTTIVVQEIVGESDVLPKPKGYKRHTGLVHQWPSYGPWL